MRLLCVDASRNKGSEYFEKWIEEGEVYTLRRYTGSLSGEQGVLLKEIVNPSVFITALNGHTEPSFSKLRFALVDDAMNIVEEAKVKEENLVLN